MADGFDDIDGAQLVVGPDDIDDGLAWPGFEPIDDTTDTRSAIERDDLRARVAQLDQQRGAE